MELDEAILKRSSVRYFSDEPVGNEEIRALIEAAIRAPTASGLDENYYLVGVIPIGIPRNEAEARPSRGRKRVEEVTRIL